MLCNTERHPPYHTHTRIYRSPSQTIFYEFKTVSGYWTLYGNCFQNKISFDMISFTKQWKWVIIYKHISSSVSNKEYLINLYFHFLGVRGYLKILWKFTWVKFLVILIYGKSVVALKCFKCISAIWYQWKSLKIRFKEKKINFFYLFFKKFWSLWKISLWHINTYTK